jgi:hypothetical protein
MSFQVRRALAMLTAVGSFLALPREADAQGVRYALTQQSQIIEPCSGCPNGQKVDVLRGGFDLTPMPVSMEPALEAITGVEWHSSTHVVRGSGFVQHVEAGRVAVVLDARINGTSVLLTSERRQRFTAGTLRIVLMPPAGLTSGPLITIVAVPVFGDEPDGDGDGIADGVDNCPTQSNAAQSDADNDNVGDTCDACADTSANSLVLKDGCTATQHCPCDGPSLGAAWENQHAYVQCINRQLRLLRRQGRIGRSEIGNLMKDAVRSGCGRRVVALR